MKSGCHLQIKGMLESCVQYLSIHRQRNKMNINKIGFFAFTGLMSAMMLFSAGMYVFNYAEVSKIFTALGYPTYIIYPLAVLKMLGLIAIWSNYSRTLKTWAYAGFFYDFVLALSAHLSIGDGDFGGAVAALVLWTGSYVFDFRLRKGNSE